jgi:hypothetical protein
MQKFLSFPEVNDLSLNMTAVTHGTGTVYSSGATDFTSGFYKAPISGCVDQCLFFVLFLLVLSVLQFTTF